MPSQCPLLGGCDPSDLLDAEDIRFDVVQSEGTLPPGVADAAAIVECVSE